MKEYLPIIVTLIGSGLGAFLAFVKTKTEKRWSEKYDAFSSIICSANIIKDRYEIDIIALDSSLRGDGGLYEGSIPQRLNYSGRNSSLRGDGGLYEGSRGNKELEVFYSEIIDENDAKMKLRKEISRLHLLVEQKNMSELIDSYSQLMELLERTPIHSEFDYLDHYKDIVEKANKVIFSAIKVSKRFLR